MGVCQEGGVRQALLGDGGGCGKPCAGAGLHAATPGRVYRETFFVMMPFYFGYASLFALQHDVKVRVGIRDDDSDSSSEFGFAISFLYIFNLLFRFLHGILFGGLSPRSRVFLAMSLMCVAMLALAVPRLPLGTHGIHWVMLAYALGGAAVGTYEPNFLSCIAPLGEETKSTAILGIPVGISSVLILGFFLMGPPFFVPAMLIYTAVAWSLLAGMGIMALRVPEAGMPHRPQAGLRRLVADVRQFRQWLPQTWSYPPVYMLDMFALSAFSPGVALYIYDGPTVSLAPGLEMATDSFFAAFNSCNMLGSLLGRWLSYRVKPRHPVVYLAFISTGAALMLMKVPLLVPLSTFLVMLGDGLIYGACTRRLDASVPEEFNLVATSFWCLLGDVGAIAGTNLIALLKAWVDR